MKKKLCVIGDPVAHSKSPAIHNAMLAHLGLDGEYEYLCKPVSAAELPSFLAEARGGDLAGFNATMPHKEALVARVDHLSDDARLFGAVNTVCIKEGKLYGYNTDGEGFLRALGEFGFHPARKIVTILGAGGVARPVALKLVQEGAKEVIICNRSFDRASGLASYDSHVMSTEVFDPDALRWRLVKSDLFVNCTNLGMAGSPPFPWPEVVEALRPDAPVCDLIYHPLETELLARAAERGHPTMNGLPTLIHQAILALEHFLGAELDPDQLAPVARKAIG